MIVAKGKTKHNKDWKIATTKKQKCHPCNVRTPCLIASLRSLISVPVSSGLISLLATVVLALWLFRYPLLVL